MCALRTVRQAAGALRWIQLGTVTFCAQRASHIVMLSHIICLLNCSCVVLNSPFKLYLNELDNLELNKKQSPQRFRKRIMNCLSLFLLLRLRPTRRPAQITKQNKDISIRNPHDINEHYALGYMCTDALWFASTFEPGPPPRVNLR